MIGNSYLRALYSYCDEDTSISQLLEFLKSKDSEFIGSLEQEPVEPDSLDDNEVIFLTKVSALIDYYLQMHGIEVPPWLRHPKLRFKYPYYHRKRISDFDKVRLIYSTPAPFRNRNVYFDLDDIVRV